jgi:predicted MPP superfamily phosphohydrolase
MFFVVIFGIFAGNVVWWLWADRAAKKLPRSRGWRTAIALFEIVVLGYILMFILIPVAARRPSFWMPMPAIAGMYVWHLVVMPATVVIALIVTLGKLARRVFAPSPRTRGEGRGEGSVRSFGQTQPLVHESLDLSPQPSPRSTGERGYALSRRQLLTAVAISAPPIVTVALTGRAVSQLDQFRIRKIDVPIANLPSALADLTVAHVSDTHIGRFTHSGILPRIVEATNQLRADLVIFTGDLIDMSLADLPTGIDFLNKLDPRHGMAAIEGNHDLFIDPDEFERRTQSASLPMLFDDTATLRVRGYPIQFLGTRWGRKTDWPRRHSSNSVIRDSVQRISALADPDAFQILLAHHPHAFDTAIEQKIPLTLSGHTHGGQLMLNENFGAGSIMYKYWSGLYQKRDSSLVVSNGTGNWFPLRINAPAEIVHITLRRITGLMGGRASGRAVFVSAKRLARRFSLPNSVTRKQARSRRSQSPPPPAPFSRSPTSPACPAVCDRNDTGTAPYP